MYFYPRPPGGGRRAAKSPPLSARKFLSTPSGWRATRIEKSGLKDIIFLSTPSGWRATCLGNDRGRGAKFLSTPSGWRATSHADARPKSATNFYPRPPGGGRRDTIYSAVRCAISIHALRVEGDLFGYDIADLDRGFLSTPSGWRATATVCATFRRGLTFLSTPSGWRATGTIHRRVEAELYFYPRPPGGGRHTNSNTNVNNNSFLSTPSGWRATSPMPPSFVTVPISIHALRVEGDWWQIVFSMIRMQFLSTPSGWRATRKSSARIDRAEISIHALRVEGDKLFSAVVFCWQNFYPRPPGGGRPESVTCRFK